MNGDVEYHYYSPLGVILILLQMLEKSLISFN